MRRIFYFLAAVSLAANTVQAVTISYGIPGVSSSSPPKEFIGGIYNFALTISGVLALGAIVYGGIRYMTSAGNPSGQSEGKEWVKGALFGLILLFGAYMILNFINPAITTLSLPALMPILPPPVPTASSDCLRTPCSPPQVCSIQNGQPMCINPQVGGSKCNGGRGCDSGFVCVGGSTYFCQGSATGCRDDHGRLGCPLGQSCVSGLGGPTCATQGDQ